MIYTANLTDLRLNRIDDYFKIIADVINPEVYFCKLSRSQQLDCIDYLSIDDIELAEKLNTLIK
jgi:hypothetical protein